LGRLGVSSLSLDLAGFGSSPPPTVATGAAGYAADLATLLEEIGAGALIVVGHSFGGRVATVLAGERPDLVSHLVLTGVPLLRSGSSARSPLAYRLLRAGAKRGLVSNARLERARQRYGSADYRAASGVMREVLVNVVNEDYERELTQSRAGVDLVWGANDSVVPVSVAERALELLGDRGRLSIAEGVGHLLPSESPGSLVEPLRRVLGA
jgi:pimeloyl-ACP methyl ester carboxylesterase